MAYGETPTTVGWRRDRDRETGEERGWKLFGPTDLLRVGQVPVTKRDGSVETVVVARVSKAFVIDGVECCYGYPATNEDEARKALAIAAARDGFAADPVPAPAAPTGEPGGDWTAPEQTGWGV